MPQPLKIDLAREQEHAAIRARNLASKQARAESLRGMRDLTKSVSSSPALPGDRTQNAESVRKSRKLADKLESHADSVAYVVSDTSIYQDEKLRAIKRSPSRLIVRNADGTPNHEDTLALVERWRLFKASESRSR